MRNGVFLLFATIGLAACQAGIEPPALSVEAPAVSVQTPSVQATAAAGVAPGQGGGPTCQGDSQCLAPDDILVCTVRSNCYAAHVLTQPSPATKNQGQYMVEHDGTTLWTGHWFVSRPVVSGDRLALGEPLLYDEGDSNGSNNDGASNPPTTRQAAITDQWRLSTITDTTNLFKNEVMMADGSTVLLSDARIITDRGDPANDF